MSNYARYVKFSVMALTMSVAQTSWVWAQQPDATQPQQKETQQQPPQADAAQQQDQSNQQPDSQQPSVKDQPQGETQQQPQQANRAQQQDESNQQPDSQQPSVDESVSSLPKIDSKLGVPPEEKFALYRVLQMRQDVRKQMQQMYGMQNRLQDLGNNIAAFYETDARLVIFGENSMQRQGYQLKKAVYFLDEDKIAEYNYQPSKPQPATGPIFEGAVSPGCHKLLVQLDYHVQQRPFPYKTGYGVRMQGAQSFRMKEGQTVVLRSVGFTQESQTSTNGKQGELQVIQFVMQAEPNDIKGKPIVNLKDVFNEAGLEVFVQNNMPSEYKLIGFEVRLNGIPLRDYVKLYREANSAAAAQSPVNNQDATGKLLFRGPVAPGTKQLLQVQVTYQGQEKNYGYLGHHQFALNFERKIDLPANATTPVQLTAYLGDPDAFVVEKTPSVRMDIFQASVGADKVELVDSCKTVEYFAAKRKQEAQQQPQGSTAATPAAPDSSPQNSAAGSSATQKPASKEQLEP